MSQSSHVCFSVSFFHLLFYYFLHFLCFHPSTPKCRCVTGSAPVVLQSSMGLGQYNISFKLFFPLCFAEIGFIKHQSPPSEFHTLLIFLGLQHYQHSCISVSFWYRITFILLWFFVLTGVGDFCFSSSFCCFSAAFMSSTTVTSIRLIGFATHFLHVV